MKSKISRQSYVAGIPMNLWSKGAYFEILHDQKMEHIHYLRQACGDHILGSHSATIILHEFYIASSPRPPAFT